MIVQIHRTAIERYDIPDAVGHDEENILDYIASNSIDPFKTDGDINLIDWEE